MEIEGRTSGGEADSPGGAEAESGDELVTATLELDAVQPDKCILVVGRGLHGDCASSRAVKFRDEARSESRGMDETTAVFNAVERILPLFSKRKTSVYVLQRASCRHYHPVEASTRDSESAKQQKASSTSE